MVHIYDERLVQDAVGRETNPDSKRTYLVTIKRALQAELAAKRARK